MYTNRHKLIKKRHFFFVQFHKGTTQLWFAWFLAFLLIITTGVTYRIVVSKLKLVLSTQIKLPVPLDMIPTKINNWIGKDVPIPTSMQRVAGNDAFLNRLYVDESTNQWVNIYIAYTARPRTMLGHRPQVCYVAGGWIHDSTQLTQIILKDGKEIPCLLHRFHKPVPNYEETVVLNFYVVNGQLTSDESVFSGVGWRTPNITGDPARYVAQVQVSSIMEYSIREAIEDMTELILDFFPNENGQVRAAMNIK
jgi:hypothetical protein